MGIVWVNFPHLEFFHTVRFSHKYFIVLGFLELRYTINEAIKTNDLYDLLVEEA